MTISAAEGPLAEVTGSRITRIRRIHYVFRGVPDTDFGPLELGFADRTILLDNAPDGETLRVRAEEWEDPFAGPLCAANRAFTDESGKWTAFDVSAEGPFATYIGDVLAGIELIISHSGKVTGVILRTGRGGVIRADVEADELFLNEITPANPAAVRSGASGGRPTASRCPRSFGMTT